MLDANIRQAVLNNITKLLRLNYLFQEQVEALVGALEARLKNGAYDHLLEPQAFARALTNDLYQHCNDGHLSVEYNPESMSQLTHFQNAEVETSPRTLDDLKAQNDGFRAVQRLTGNVGCIELRSFEPAVVAEKTAAAALEFVANCDALIIDLRANVGGDPAMVQRLASAFFPGDAVHLNTYHDARDDTQQHFWTLPDVSPKLPSIPVYILVSRNTFSAAEEFAYDLQSLKRAVIVGEPTGGGAHLTESHVAGRGFLIHIPVAYAINPVTRTNWQGTGVQPDIGVPSETALYTAHTHALETLMHTTAGERQHTLRWDLETARAAYQPSVIRPQPELAGQYGQWLVVVENDRAALCYQHTRCILSPVTDTLFVVNDNARVQFVWGEAGGVAQMVYWSRNGTQTIFPRLD